MNSLQLGRRNYCNFFILVLLLIPYVHAKPYESPKTRPLLIWKNCTMENFPSIARLGLPNEYTAVLGTMPSLDCAELNVPVDWSKPSGENITLGMARYHTTGAGRRLGSIIYNPGGPGDSGSVTAMAQALGVGHYSSATVGYYDVIGLDPRGIGMSTPVKCDPDSYNARASTFPTDDSEFEELVRSNKAFGEGCRNRTGDLFYHLDTVSVARDVEAVRVALNDGPLNWIGLSYGTQIGSTYIELYPEQVGRMVLDGNVDHSQSETSTLHAEAATYEETLNRFFDWCNINATADECPLQNQSLPHLFSHLIRRAERHPIPALGCTDSGSTCSPLVSGEDILYNVQPMLTFAHPISGTSGNWEYLAQALSEAINGNATLFTAAVVTSDTDASFPNLAIGCLDWAHNATSMSDLRYKQQLAEYIAPLTKGASQSYLYQSACIGWPAQVINPPRLLDQVAMNRAPPILMVNAYHDPETSYVWAEGLHAQIPSSVMLTRNGSGHTSYALGGATTAAIDAYLVNGTLPLPNTVLNS